MKTFLFCIALCMSFNQVKAQVPTDPDTINTTVPEELKWENIELGVCDGIVDNHGSNDGHRSISVVPSVRLYSNGTLTVSFEDIVWRTAINIIDGRNHSIVQTNINGDNAKCINLGTYAPGNYTLYLIMENGTTYFGEFVLL